MTHQDFTTEQRKKDHIDLAFKAQLQANQLDPRFYYEPLLAPHPNDQLSIFPTRSIAGKTLKFPLWVSSMTGGTQHAAHINSNLAKACHQFGMGMGLGSCRILLDEPKYFSDFNVRKLIGDDLPFFANMGVAQLETMISQNAEDQLDKLIEDLQADGLIIHVNPLQEWFQPEGDIFKKPPIEIVERLLEKASYPIIVKEVGQGMGPKSLEALLKLPIEAIDFGAAGGTNFSLLEALRSNNKEMDAMKPMAQIGHSIYEMVELLNTLIAKLGSQRQCNMAIISGGVTNYLDAYYCMQKLNMPSIYAQASALLKRALHGVDELNTYIDVQREGLKMAYQFLTIKE